MYAECHARAESDKVQDYVLSAILTGRPSTEHSCSSNSVTSDAFTFANCGLIGEKVRPFFSRALPCLSRRAPGPTDGMCGQLSCMAWRGVAAASHVQGKVAVSVSMPKTNRCVS